MVDDPSGYVDVLLSDTKKRRAAELELKKRLAAHAAKRSLAHVDAIAEPGLTLEKVIADQERERLFAIIKELVLWENTTNEEVLEQARTEIRQSWRRACAENAAHPRATEIFDRHKLPAFHDPFAGGGALPLEAQRLGLEAHASDLNPVAVLINKAMIEIPPKFAGQAAVNPAVRQQKSLIERATGRGPRVWPKTSATTASGCATRPNGASGICIRRSRSPRKWSRSGPTWNATRAAS